MPIDMMDFRVAAFELRMAGDGLDKDLREGIRAAGQGALDAVRESASWSTRIPAATRVKVSLAARRPGISVVTSAAAAPEARPLNNGGRDGTFRHPVYGDRANWVEQKARPFFDAAAKAPAIDRELEKVLEHVTFLAGFK